MGRFFFSGLVETKLDAKNRFVLPQNLRYGFVEEGKLEFTLVMGLGGSIAIYPRKTIDQIVERLREKQNHPRYQKAFTLFFSTMYHLTCDKLGRVVLPASLKKMVKIETQIVICGVMDKVEVWAKDRYEQMRLSVESGVGDSSVEGLLVDIFDALDTVRSPEQTQEDRQEVQQIPEAG